MADVNHYKGIKERENVLQADVNVNINCFHEDAWSQVSDEYIEHWYKASLELQLRESVRRRCEYIGNRVAEKLGVTDGKFHLTKKAQILQKEQRAELMASREALAAHYHYEMFCGQNYVKLAFIERYPTP